MQYMPLALSNVRKGANITPIGQSAHKPESLHQCKWVLFTLIEITPEVFGVRYNEVSVLPSEALKFSMNDSSIAFMAEQPHKICIAYEIFSIDMHPAKGFLTPNISWILPANQYL